MAKRKGNKSERTVANLLSIWFFNDSDYLMRSPSSGSLRWSQMVAGTRGDIVAPLNINWPFSIECKNQEKGKWDLLSLITGQGSIFEWMDQCETDAKASNKIPWLIMKRNQIPYISILHKESFFLKPLNTFITELPKVYFELNNSNGVRRNLIISTLAEVLKANDPNRFMTNNVPKSDKESEIIQTNVFNILKKANK